MPRAVKHGQMIRTYPEPNDKKLTRDEAADRLNVTARTLRRWAAKGFGPPFYRTPTGRIWHLESEVEAYRKGLGLDPEGRYPSMPASVTE